MASGLRLRPGPVAVADADVTVRMWDHPPGENPSGRGVWMVGGAVGWVFVQVADGLPEAGVLGWGLVHEAGNRSRSRRGQASNPTNLTAPGGRPAPGQRARVRPPDTPARCAGAEDAGRGAACCQVPGAVLSDPGWAVRSRAGCPVTCAVRSCGPRTDRRPGMICWWRRCCTWCDMLNRATTTPFGTRARSGRVLGTTLVRAGYRGHPSRTGGAVDPGVRARAGGVDASVSGSCLNLRDLTASSACSHVVWRSPFCDPEWSVDQRRRPGVRQR
jgi:hypothetical protein